MIIWDERKNKKLKAERGISFEEVEEIIKQDKYLDIIENPSRASQDVFVVKINNYIHLVPFVLDDKSNIILKTIFPSRKFNKIYGKKDEEDKTN
ncbi:MAG: BrnT family toxin [Melioribacteraceae bacterium]|nr:BrnT family toxin [Melioribacteraceae bacterium]MCF8263982.1 BrnT family toxin [Melioribacteraceae bacterium]MCF8430739.1 BrnT family toxin [Melioribacteraceae bacterium]